MHTTMLYLFLATAAVVAVAYYAQKKYSAHQADPLTDQQSVEPYYVYPAPFPHQIRDTGFNEHQAYSQSYWTAPGAYGTYAGNFTASTSPSPYATTKSLDQSTVHSRLTSIPDSHLTRPESLIRGSGGVSSKRSEKIPSEKTLLRDADVLDLPSTTSSSKRGTCKLDVDGGASLTMSGLGMCPEGEGSHQLSEEATRHPVSARDPPTYHPADGVERVATESQAVGYRSRQFSRTNSTGGGTRVETPSDILPEPTPRDESNPLATCHTAVDQESMSISSQGPSRHGWSESTSVGCSDGQSASEGSSRSPTQGNSTLASTVASSSISRPPRHQWPISMVYNDDLDQSEDTLPVYTSTDPDGFKRVHHRISLKQDTSYIGRQNPSYQPPPTVKKTSNWETKLS